jgi:hypothetical protein
MRAPANKSPNHRFHGAASRESWQEITARIALEKLDA